LWFAQLSLTGNQRFPHSENPTYREAAPLAQLASRAELEQAVELAKALKAAWPRKYLVCDPEGNDVDLTEYAAIEPERGTVLSRETNTRYTEPNL
jgi:hypothetical protein